MHSLTVRIGLLISVVLAYIINAAPNLTPGTWVDITPKGVGSFWVSDIQIDSKNPNVLYAVLGEPGIFKSTDQGSTWTALKPSTGSFSNPFRIRVSPDQPDRLYLICGVHGTGFYTSSDGGATWTTPAGWAALMDSIHEDNMYNIAVDPTDFNHILISFYMAWSATQWYVSGGNAGVVESKDGGNSWIIHRPRQEFTTDNCHNIAFLYDPAHNQGDPNTWIFSNRSSGIWRTTNAGTSWTQVSSSLNITRSQYYYTAKAGVLYGAANNMPIRSLDNGATWIAVTGISNNYYYGICGDGTLLYTLPVSGGPVLVSSESDGMSWHAFNNQSFCEGANVFTYDSSSHIMYMAGKSCGLFALKTSSSTIARNSPAAAAQKMSTPKASITVIAGGRNGVRIISRNRKSHEDFFTITGRNVDKSNTPGRELR